MNSNHFFVQRDLRKVVKNNQMVGFTNFMSYNFTFSCYHVFIKFFRQFPYKPSPLILSTVAIKCNFDMIDHPDSTFIKLAAIAANSQLE